MAIMHPSNILETYHAYSEVKFFNACKEQLNDKYHVFYSVRWYSLKNGEREDSECDFLIFNPDYGFLCIEVKGGKGIRIENGNWYLIEKEGERQLKRSPYEQAEQSMWFFKKYYEDELETQFPGIYGCAAAFPNYSIKSSITVGTSLENTMDLDDMNNLQKRVIEVFRFFSNHHKGSASFLSPDSQKKFISLINKRIALSISAGALIEDKEHELIEINRTQDTIIDLLIHYTRAFIIGGAGTGKTWIGIKKVQRCIQSGGTALYLCYNRALADMVRQELSPLACCQNFDAYMYLLLGEKVATVPVNNGNCKEYSNILDKIQNLKKFDLVVVDEAQDFTEDWAYCVNLLLKDTGSLYVFYDENQNIFDRDFGDKFYITSKPFVLRYNIRNTANIYKYAQLKTDLGLDTVANTIEGVEPDCRTFTRQVQAVSFVDSVINKLVNNEGVLQEKIVILSNRKKENSILNNIESVGGCDIIEGVRPHNKKAISFFTIQSFKGLEADVVIYINHTYKNELRTETIRATQYAAMTRARFYLYILNFEKG